jgi:hypothetical protein
MKNFIKILLLAITPLCGSVIFGQTASKQVSHNTLSWVSINSNLFLNKQWFIMADAHLRENNFFSSTSFIFGRVGLGYQFNKNLSAVAGYGNLLLSPTTAGWTTKSDESRIFEQIQFSAAYGKLKIVQRLRNEQRWVQIIANNTKTGNNKFTDRVRYLFSATFPVFKTPKLPQLAFADECMLQFGSAVVYNTFDQNRIFAGIKQKINNNLSFDAGYMRIFQQKNNGSSYTLSDCYRLFFYYTLPPKKSTTK